MHNKQKATNTFLTELCALLAAHINLLDALDLLTLNQTSNDLKKIILKIKIELLTGAKLYQAFKNHLFLTASEINLIKFSETSGTLDVMLPKIITARAQIAQLKQQLLQAACYPIILLISSCGLIFFATQYLLPKFLLLAQNTNMQLPATTQLLITTTNLLQNYFIYFLGFFLLTISAVAFLYHYKIYIKLWLDKKIIFCPFLGILLRDYYHATFCYLLSTSLTAGICLQQALPEITPTFTNIFYKKNIINLTQHISGGNHIHSFLQHNNLFSVTMIRMIAIGEKSGSLEKILLTLHQDFSKKLTNKLTMITTLLPPVLIAIMGTIVAFIVAAIYLPLLQIGDY